MYFNKIYNKELENDLQKRDKEFTNAKDNFQNTLVSLKTNILFISITSEMIFFSSFNLFDSYYGYQNLYICLNM